MATVIRVVGATVAGMLVAFVLVIAVELLSAVVHPLPADFGGTQEEMCAHVERYPAWVLALAVPAWAAIAFLGTWIAGRFGNLGAALVVGLLLVASVVFNVSMLPYPLWFKLGCLLAVPGAVAAAIHATRRGRTPVAR